MASKFPTFAPSIYNDPGRLDVNFTKSSGMIAAAVIFSSIFIIGIWAIFYVYWYMPWHGKKLHDCCGRELDNSCSHDCVMKCKEDLEACPGKCDEACPGCQGQEPLSIRARDPTWNKSHLENQHLGPVLSPLPGVGSVQNPTFQPNQAPSPPFEYRPPSVGSRGISPLAAGGSVPVYNPNVGAPRIIVEAPSMPSMPSMPPAPPAPSNLPTMRAPEVPVGK